MGRFGQEPIRLDEGDVVIFSQGDHHVMSSTPGLRAETEDANSVFKPKPPQLPLSIGIGAAATEKRLVDVVVQHTAEAFEVEARQGAAGFLGQGVADRVGVTDSLALDDLEWTLVWRRISTGFDTDAFGHVLLEGKVRAGLACALPGDRPSPFPWSAARILRTPLQ